MEPEALFAVTPTRYVPSSDMPNNADGASRASLEGIISSRLYVHEGLPEGPQWKQVQRLLKSVKGKQPRRPARQSRLVAPDGLRIAQRGDIASAVERLRLAVGDVHGEPLQARRAHRNIRCSVRWAMPSWNTSGRRVRGLPAGICSSR